MNLQCIVESLQNFWSFSFALDMVTHMPTAYCDFRIRIYHEYIVHDFHLLFIPVHDRHTGNIIFNAFTKDMDDLYSYWSEKNIGGSSNGKKKILG